MDLDRMVTSADQDYKPLGSLKVTTQKFYRINGGATQLKGVASDITMTDKFNEIELGEREQDFVMEWDEIKPAAYVKWQPPYNEKKVVEASEKRMKDNEVMQLVAENAVRLKDQREKTKVSLNYEEFTKEQNMLDEENETYKNLMKPIEGLEVLNLRADLETIEADTVTADLNEKWLKKLKKDVYLDEAVNVIKDMKS
jgi:carboxyl-terminal processing protease